MEALTCSKRAVQAGSYASMTIARFSGPPMKTVSSTRRSLFPLRGEGKSGLCERGRDRLHRPAAALPREIGRVG